jgi:hypothetical protein
MSNVGAAYAEQSASRAANGEQGEYLSVREMIGSFVALAGIYLVISRNKTRNH